MASSPVAGSSPCDRCLVRLRGGLHLGEELLRPLLHLLWGEVLYVLCQPPTVPKRVFETPGAITPELIVQRHDLLGTCLNRSLPRLIHILAVDEEADRRPTVRLWSLTTLVRHLVIQHDDRVADFDLRVHDHPARPRKPHELLSSESLLVEVDGLCRASNYDARRDSVIPSGNSLRVLWHVSSCVC